MASDDKYKNKNPFIDSDKDDESGSDSGTGGQGGKIEFVDFLDTHSGKRDDLLPAEEQRRLLSIHQDDHKTRVQHQKEQIELNEKLKNGKISLRTYRAGKGAGAGGSMQFKENPALANYGSGIDPKVISLPNENTAETNPEQRDELTNELKYRLGYQPSPKFNPKPAGP